jgi:hypothetical protein
MGVTAFPNWTLSNATVHWATGILIVKHEWTNRMSSRRRDSLAIHISDLQIHVSSKGREKEQVKSSIKDENISGNA